MEAVVNMKMTVGELNTVVEALTAAIINEQTFRTTTNAEGIIRKESFAREAQLTAIRDKLK